MQTNITKKILDMLNRSPIFIKIKNEINESKFIQPLLVMAVMGWIPSAWLYLTPVLVVYGVLKRKELSEYLKGIRQSIHDFFEGSEEEQLEAKNNKTNRSFLSHHVGQWLGEKISSAPLNAAKLGLSSYIFIMSGMPWSLFMIYALYRPKTEILEAIYKQLQLVAGGLQGFFQKLTNVQKVLATLVGVSLGSTIIRSIFVEAGLLGIFDAAMTVTMLGLTVAGFRLAMTDLAQTLSHPLKLLTHRMGVFLGIIAGNRLAHNLFFAKISGSLGPTYGTIESSGFFSSIYRMLFSNDPYSKDSFYFANSLYNRLATGTGSLLGNLFFSHTASTYGTFHGTLGPSSYQLLFFMVVGGVVGYFIDKAVDKVSTKFFADAGEAWDNKPDSPSHSKFIQRIKSLLNFTNNYRYPLVSTLTVTYLMHALRMPMYIHVLHACNSPMLTLLFIEGGLLLPAMLATKAYRMAKERFYPAIKQPTELVVPEIIPALDENKEQNDLEAQKSKEPELTEILAAKLNSGSSADDELSAKEEEKMTAEQQQEHRPEPVLFAAAKEDTQPELLKKLIVEEERKEEAAPVIHDHSSSNSLHASEESESDNDVNNEGQEIERGRSPSPSPVRSASASQSPVRNAGSRSVSRSSSASRESSRSRSRSTSPHL